MYNQPFGRQTCSDCWTVSDGMAVDQDLIKANGFGEPGRLQSSMTHSPNPDPGTLEVERLYILTWVKLRKFPLRSPMITPIIVGRFSFSTLTLGYSGYLSKKITFRPGGLLGTPPSSRAFHAHSPLLCHALERSSFPSFALGVRWNWTDQRHELCGLPGRCR